MPGPALAMANKPGLLKLAATLNSSGRTGAAVLPEIKPVGGSIPPWINWKPVPVSER